MLILNMEVRKTIRINERIKLSIQGIKQDKSVLIGVDAPPDVAITRPDMKNRKPKKKSKAGSNTDTT